MFHQPVENLSGSPNLPYNYVRPVSGPLLPCVISSFPRSVEGRCGNFPHRNCRSTRASGFTFWRIPSLQIYLCCYWFKSLNVYAYQHHAMFKKPTKTPNKDWKSAKRDKFLLPQSHLSCFLLYYFSCYMLSESITLNANHIAQFQNI